MSPHHNHKRTRIKSNLLESRTHRGIRKSLAFLKPSAWRKTPVPPKDDLVDGETSLLACDRTSPASVLRDAGESLDRGADGGIAGHREKFRFEFNNEVIGDIGWGESSEYLNAPSFDAPASLKWESDDQNESTLHRNGLPANTTYSTSREEKRRGRIFSHTPTILAEWLSPKEEPESSASEKEIDSMSTAGITTTGSQRRTPFAHLPTIISNAVLNFHVPEPEAESEVEVEPEHTPIKLRRPKSMVSMPTIEKQRPDLKRKRTMQFYVGRTVETESESPRKCGIEPRRRILRVKKNGNAYNDKEKEVEAVKTNERSEHELQPDAALTAAANRPKVHSERHPSSKTVEENRHDSENKSLDQAFQWPEDCF